MNKALKWALKAISHHSMSSSATFILLVIAIHCDEESNNGEGNNTEMEVHVTHKEIRHWTGYSETTVFKAIRELRREGLFRTQEINGKATIYYLLEEDK